MIFKKTTMTFLAVFIITFSGGLYDAYAQVKVMYQCIESNPASSRIEAAFSIVNQSPNRINLLSLAFRYYYTNEGASSETATVETARMGVSHISAMLHDGYLEIGFGNEPGILYPGAETGEIRIKIVKTDSSLYDQSDDLSFSPSMTAFTANSNITLHLNGNDTPIWPVPTPAPTSPYVTCPPCNPTMKIESFTVNDDLNIFSDNDHLPDAGEIVGIGVSCIAMGCCVPNSDKPKITVTTDYPKCIYLGYAAKPEITGDFAFYISPDAQCDDEITFYINAYLDENSSSYQDHLSFTLRVGSKPVATGTNTPIPGYASYTCDLQIPNPTFSPIMIEAEDFDAASGVIASGSIADSCDNGDWVEYEAVDFGPGIFYKRFTASLAGDGSLIRGEIELHLDSPYSSPYCTMLVEGTGGTFLEKDLVFNPLSGKHDVFLVFRGGQSIARIDRISFGPERPIPLDKKGAVVTIPPWPHATMVPVAPSIDLQQAGFLFGSGRQPHAIAIEGNHAYISSAYYHENPVYGMTVYDITDKSNPRLTGFISPSQYYLVNMIVIAGDRAYMKEENPRKITLVDIADKENPAIIGEISSTNIINRFAVSGGFVYQTIYDTGLVISDTSTPSAPVQVGTFPVSDSACDIKVKNDYAYITCNPTDSTLQGLYIVDVRSKTNPVQIGFLAIPRASELDVSGGYAYVGSFLSDTTGLTIVDISNPTNPSIVGSLPFRAEADTLEVRDDRVYWALGNQGMAIINVSDKTAPVFAGSFDRNVFGFDLDSAGNLWVGGMFTIRSFSVLNGAPTPGPTPVTVTPSPVPQRPSGDVNNDGQADIVDALVVAMYYVGILGGTPDPAYADVDCNGSMDIVDALRIAQYYVGLVTSLGC